MDNNTKVEINNAVAQAIDEQNARIIAKMREHVQAANDRKEKTWETYFHAPSAEDGAQPNHKALSDYCEAFEAWQAVTDLAIQICGVIGDGWSEIASVWNNDNEEVERMYTFGYFNGNAGRELAFDSFREAKEAAEEKWRHLTSSEKKKYTAPEDGAYFAVFRGGNGCDDCEVVFDFADAFAEELRA